MDIKSHKWHTSGLAFSEDGNHTSEAIVEPLSSKGDGSGDGPASPSTPVWSVQYFVEGLHHSVQVTCMDGAPLKINVPRR